MARVVEEIVVVKISRIVRDGNTLPEYVDDELVTGIENILLEGVELPDGAVLEVAKLEK